MQVMETEAAQEAAVQQAQLEEEAAAKEAEKAAAKKAKKQRQKAQKQQQQRQQLTEPPQLDEAQATANALQLKQSLPQQQQVLAQPPGEGDAAPRTKKQKAKKLQQRRAETQFARAGDEPGIVAEVQLDSNLPMSQLQSDEHHAHQQSGLSDVASASCQQPRTKKSKQQQQLESGHKV